MPKNKKLALKLGILTYQILTNDDEVCIPSLSSILLAVLAMRLQPDLVSAFCNSPFRSVRLIGIYNRGQLG